MNLAVTVGAATIEEPALIFRIIGSVTGVTLGAEPGHAYFQHAVIDGTVRLMAVGAILGNRRMLMKVWPSPLRMTGVAVLVYAVLLELRRIGAPMRVVAIGTRDLSFP